MKCFFTMALLAIAAGSASANDNIPPAKQASPLLFTGATIHTVSGDPIPAGQLLVVNGTILAVTGEHADLKLPPGTKTIDLSGKHLYPGMIAANSVLGLTEIDAVRATLDMVEPGDINPNARAQISINPDSELIPVTRANGVLAALTIPRTGSRGLLAGASALARLDGWTWEEMTIASPVGMHLFWPAFPVPRGGTQPAAEQQKETEKLRKAYDKSVEKLRQAFADARAYARAYSDPESGIKTDLRWEAMIPVVEGDLPVFIHAQTITQIRHALHFAGAQEIARPVIVGGRDAWRITDELLKQDAAVILSPVNDLPQRRWEPYDTPYAGAAKLLEAGVRFCIANSGSPFDAANERNLPYQAGRAVAYGLPRDVALKSVTLYPAQILGVADRLGSIDSGKEATFFVSDGDPLEVRTHIEQAYIRGREISLESKHTRLYHKYQEKYRQESGG